MLFGFAVYGLCRGLIKVIGGLFRIYCLESMDYIGIL